LNGDLRPRCIDCVAKVEVDGYSQISLKADGASEIDADMLRPASTGTDKLQALFLGDQSGDAGAHLTRTNQQYADEIALS
jgi:hypothetical protein